MLTFDPNKSLIIVFQGQSNAAGRGFWSNKSTTGLYNAYQLLQSTIIDAKLLTSENMILGAAFTSDVDGDLYELGNLAAWGSSEGANNLGINMGYSFVIDLMTYLNGLSYTKNVWYLQHGYGGTTLTSNPNAKDWNPANRELLFESMNKVKDVIDHEKQVNGNDSQVIVLWHQGESDANVHATYQAMLGEVYQYQANVLGVPHHLFMGQIVPKNANCIAINAAIQAYTVENPNAHMVGEDLPGGITTWGKMEDDDPDGTILEANQTTYTTAGDLVHYNWKAQILQGRQLYDLVLDKFF